MEKWKRWCMALAVATGAASSLQAQVPASVPATAAVAPAQATGSGQTLWKFLGLSRENLTSCKTKFCQSQLGQMMNNGMKPISSMTGGVVPGCCPLVNPADLAKPADSAEGAAARIKADEAAAKARREAVRYLGTVDCRFWPEAQDGLINALRTDRNECVRLEAALALSRGCCCNKKTIKALSISVAGTDEDGNPAENSERVRAVAAGALQNCLAHVEATPLPEKIPEQPREALPPPQPEGVTSLAPPGGNEARRSQQFEGDELAGTAYYKNLRSTTMKDVTVKARQTLTNPKTTVPQTAPAASAKDGLLGIIKSSMSSSPRETDTAQPSVLPAPLPPAPRDKGTGEGGGQRAEDKQPTAEDRGIRTVANNSVPPPPHQSASGGLRPPLATPRPEACSESQKCGPYGGVLGKLISPRTRQECVEPIETPPAVPVNRIERHSSAQPAVPTPRPSQSGRETGASGRADHSASIYHTPAAHKASPDDREAKAEDKAPMVAVAHRPHPVEHSAMPQAIPTREKGSRAEVPARSSLAETMKHMAVLRNSIYPEEREQAANSLGKVDWRTQPQVVQVLLTAAYEDQTPRVRATCIRCLAHMHANTQPVITTLMQLRNDQDMLIQQESLEALARLTGNQPVPAGRGSSSRNVTSIR